MPPERKTEDSTAKPAQDPSTENQQTDERSEDPAVSAEGTDLKKAPEENSKEGPAEDDAAAKARQRQERFKALQSRAVSIPRAFLFASNFSLPLVISLYRQLSDTFY